MSMPSSIMLPIREVSRVTGVNAVTLRAWERRYGLITPHRTGKGHRLYTEENVQQIQDILTWLGRGVAVGQVKELLHAPQPVDEDANSPWHEMRRVMIQAFVQYDAAELDRILSVTLQRHDADRLCHFLLEPVLEQLQQRWQGQFGSQLEMVFCHSWLRSNLAAHLHAKNSQLHGRPILLVNLSEQHCEAGIWLLALMLNAQGIPFCMLEWEVPASELALLAERCQPRAMLFFSSQALALNQLRRQLPKLVQLQPVPVIVAGPAARIHEQELAELGILALPERASIAYPLLLAQLRTLQ
ncbi:MerR family transcriptional regulator [Halopseudomonas pelagia]|uniref:Helix-turn-helix-type transcriptional regulator n=1 Tax=Halopseudomonas pelagia TaxID=553151 RepID=A0AA91U5S9_9GAMM|nr:MerR family transcriptional regulator [Halopseudomonas pelagia]PCD01349.1 helix-turn-helix-type transcriptional regulator [Halopseudomonas pelagia]QFY55799.1 MerR family transcriptional regulator [Halopseudomonas pelagia]